MRDIADAFYCTLMRTQFLESEKMVQYQRHLMEGLVRHARATTPFYRDTGRLDALFRSDDTIDWSRWDEVPTFSRLDAQAHREELCAEHVPAQMGRILTGMTSGSTGSPFVHLRTELQNAGESALTERFFSWHQIDRDAAYAKILDSRNEDHGGWKGEVISNWNLQNSQAPLHLLHANAPAGQQVDWLLQTNARYLETYANIASVIVEQLSERPPNFKLDTFFNIGEVLRDHLRERLERLGVQAIDVYSSREIGILAQECPHCGLMHLASETTLLELVDDDDRPTASGEAGRVITTPFYSYAMPLIRYDIGDRAIAAKRDSECPFTLGNLKEVIGRQRQPFILRSGSKRWLPLRSSELSKVVDYKQFQIVQTAIGRIEIRVVSSLENPVKDRKGLDALIACWLTEPTLVDVIKIDAISRSRSGKIQDVVSLISF